MKNMYLGPHDYIIVYFDEDYTGPNWPVANINISETEYIYLTNSRGKVVSKIECVKTEPNISFGYFEKELTILIPTPNEKNKKYK